MTAPAAAHRRGRRRMAVAALGLALLLCGGGGAATATEPRLADAGWWWRLQAGLGVDLPAPPSVSPGQLPVQGAPDGPTMVSAVRFALPAGTDAAAGATLTLTIAEGTVPAAPGGSILACPAEGWFGEEAGSWDRRPEGDCTASVPGSSSDDGATWAFEVGLLVDDDELDVVLIPGPVEDVDAVGAPLDVVFERPTTGALDVGSSGDAFDAPEVVIDAAGTAQLGTAPLATDDPALAPPDLGSGGGTPPLASPSPPAPATEVAPSEPTGTVELEGGGSGAIRPVVADAAREGARWLGFLLLAAAALGALWSSFGPEGGIRGIPGIRGIGPLALAGAPGSPAGTPDGIRAEDRPGGIGRFARPRTGRPPSLR
jgi:hypothetical protein